MKKLLSIGLGVALVASFAASAFAGPSRLILQEMGTTVAQGEVNLDLINAANLAAVNPSIPGTFGTQLNVGAFGGEVRVTATNVGYKFGVAPNTALYATLGIDSPSPGLSSTSFSVGGAWTTSTAGMILNLNPVYYSNQVAGVTTTVLDINGAVLFPMMTNVLAGVELLYNSTAVGAAPATSGLLIAVGGRWTISPTVVADLAIYTNYAPSVGATTSVIATPAVLRLNVKI